MKTRALILAGGGRTGFRWPAPHGVVTRHMVPIKGTTYTRCMNKRAQTLDPAVCAALIQSKRWQDKTAPAKNGCIEWTGARNPKGYGQIRLNAKQTSRTHRVAYVAATGLGIPDGMFVDHLCRNTSCVNPDHLELVTTRENLMRGNTLAAKQVARTHCPQGHELSDDNLVPSSLKQGMRGCLTCDHARNRQRAAIIKQARLHLGMSKQEYVAVYGQSRAAAEAVLAQ